MASFARRALEKARAAAGRALGRLLGPSGEPPSAGERGEREAARFLKRRGYRILERNYRCRLGEIDLVVFRKGVLAFVEVRTRTEPALVPAPETVTAEKRRRITRAAHDYLAQHHLGGEDVSLRFDVVAIHYRADDGSESSESMGHIMIACNVCTNSYALALTSGSRTLSID